jgi:hypothetical protein
VLLPSFGQMCDLVQTDDDLQEMRKLMQGGLETMLGWKNRARLKTTGLVSLPSSQCPN